MGSDWATYKLEDISAIKSGKRLPKGESLTSSKTAHPYIRLVDIEHGKISPSNVQYLAADTQRKISRYIVESGDVCLAIVGHTIGVVFYIDDEWNDANLTENAARLTAFSPKVNSRFIYYYLTSPTGQSEILSRKVGSAQGKLPLYNIKAMELKAPSRKIQDRIVDVLSKLDQKITLNRQINQTLEQMAQTLFKSWFVDFDPVIDNALDVGNPIPDELQHRAEARKSVRESEDFKPLPDDVRQLFPDAFEESELGWVPKGWGVTRLENILELAYGKALTKTDRVDGKYPVYGSGGVNGTHKTYLVKGPGIIVGRKGTVGSLHWERNHFFPIDTVFYVKPHIGYSLTYCFYLLKTLGLETMNTDAAVPGLNRNNAYRLKCVIPSEEVREHLTKTLTDGRKKMDACLENIETLSKLRDELLPKLISGDIKIGDSF